MTGLRAGARGHGRDGIHRSKAIERVRPAAGDEGVLMHVHPPAKAHAEAFSLADGISDRRVRVFEVTTVSGLAWEVKK